MVIAFIDGPADTSHLSLREASIEVFDRTRSASHFSRAHATFIASVLAGTGPHCLGLARNCLILSIGVVDEAMLEGLCPPRESAARLAGAVLLALRLNARVIQISLDLAFSPSEARPLIDAIDAAVRRGAVVVAAVGHRPSAALNPVLAIAGVIAVSGADRVGQPHHCGIPVGSPMLNVSEISAPSVDIPGALLPTGTGLRSGTSFAACFVTAAIALMCAGFCTTTSRDAALRLLAGRHFSRRYARPVSLDVDGCCAILPLS
jgi:subtilisin family serine protease